MDGINEILKRNKDIAENLKASLTGAKEAIEETKDFFKKAKKAIGEEKLNINFQKKSKDAIIPSYAHNGDVGMDLTAISVEYDKEKDIYIYHTGIALESEKHYGVFLFPRSSNRNTEAYLCNHVGIVDSALYRGEIMLCYKNRTSLRTLAKINGFDSLKKALSKGMDLKEAIQISNEAESTVKMMAENLEFAPYKVGERIAQMVVFAYPDIQANEVETLNSTIRNANGFGSTGK
jgi:dUTP pyrophosphatase